MSFSMNITLRIKRKYFDLILSGKKHIEYRDVKDYYNRLFRHAQEIQTLTLHYQKERKLVCKVKEIKKMSVRTAKSLTPEEFTSDDVSFGTHVYAIFVRDPKLIRG